MSECECEGVCVCVCVCVCVNTYLTDDTSYNEHSTQVSQHLYDIFQVLNRISSAGHV